MDRTYHRIPVPLAISLTVGMAASLWFPRVVWAAAVLTVLSVVVMAVSIRSGRLLRFSPLAAFLGLGFLLAFPWTSTNHPPDHITGYCRQAPWRIEGTVLGVMDGHGDRTRLVLDRISVKDAGGERRLKGGLQTVVFGECQRPAPGDRVQFNGKLRPLRNFGNPGGFDYRRYQAFKGIHASAYTSGKHLSVLPGAAGPSGLKGVAEFRSFVVRMIDRHAPPEAAAVLKALLVGDRSGISRELRDRFSRTGVGHLLAISGLHVGIVATTVYGLLALLMSRVPLLLERAWVRKAASIGTAVSVIGYGALAGGSPSTQRAVIMVLLFLASFWIDRDGDLFGFIALAAIGICVIDPPAVFSLSFQLSFAAVLTIVAGMRRFGFEPDTAASLRVRAMRRLIGSLMVSVLAVVGTLPLAMGAFGEVSIIGVGVNLVAVPLVGFGVLPLGLFSVAISGAAPEAAGLGFSLCGRMIDLLLYLLEVVSDLDYAAVLAPSLTPIETCLYYALLATLLLAGASRWRNALLLGLTVAVLVDGAFWYHERFGHRELRITALDVGQGASTLVEFPGGHIMLIDGGGFSSNRLFDVGRRIVSPVLRYKKILTVDTMVLSHANADHMNGLYAIADRFRVKRLWISGGRTDSESFRNFSALVSNRNIPVSQVHRNRPPESIGPVRVSILHPPEGWDGAGGRSGPDLDDHSVVVKLETDAVGVLAPGDIRMKAESDILRWSTPGQVRSEILFAPHHGSRTSSSRSFIDAVRPRVVIASAGWSNRFGFPHPETIERYRHRGCMMFRTDLDGAVLIRVDGRRVAITGHASGREAKLLL
ncbi:MAG: DNA internalization-related competence protein ComEC/Rec2 [Desulfobacterales bacterium]